MTKQNNKTSGTTFEKHFARYLSNKGFWVHCIQDRHNGQPFDVIACRNNKPFAFDCKVCSDDYFALARIEENQKSAMERYLATGNKYCYFAFLFGEEIVIVHYRDLRYLTGSRVPYAYLKQKEVKI